MYTYYNNIGKPSLYATYNYCEIVRDIARFVRKSQRVDYFSRLLMDPLCSVSPWGSSDCPASKWNGNGMEYRPCHKKLATLLASKALNSVWSSVHGFQRNIVHCTIVTLLYLVVLVVQWFGVRLVIERSLVWLPAGALSSQLGVDKSSTSLHGWG